MIHDIVPPVAGPPDALVKRNVPVPPMTEPVFHVNVAPVCVTVTPVIVNVLLVPMVNVPETVKSLV